MRDARRVETTGERATHEQQECAPSRARVRGRSCCRTAHRSARARVHTPRAPSSPSCVRVPPPVCAALLCVMRARALCACHSAGARVILLRSLCVVSLGARLARSKAAREEAHHSGRTNDIDIAHRRRTAIDTARRCARRQRRATPTRSEHERAHQRDAPHRAAAATARTGRLRITR
jgi:hypothetical protein